jgi:UbiD family decarboxylase
MAPPGDLREWIRLLEDEGELVRVSAEVDPDLEITEIVDRTVKAAALRSCSSGRKDRSTRS